jgi:hypothetical protein
MLSACGEEGSSTSGTGTLSLGLMDASTEDYKAVYITVKEVQVHAGEETDKEDNDSWQVVATPNKTYNLLELVNGVIEQLGLTDLEAGHYTQLRMIIGETADDGTNTIGETHPFANYIIDNSDAYYELKIPSGYQTGVKIVHGFDIAEDQVTELVLDFDASKSVVKAGNSGKWLLKPTIKVIETKESATISGIVTEVIDQTNQNLEGVVVSAQQYDPDSEDIKDQVISQGSTITDESGSYLMYLWAGTYNIVLYKDGYSIGCSKIAVESGSSYAQDFTLNTFTTGAINGNVAIEDAAEDLEAVLSFRQDFQCQNSNEAEPIEVKSESIADGGTYNTNLPEGTYSLVASTEGRTTQEYTSIVLTSVSTITQDITFEFE